MFEYYNSILCIHGGWLYRSGFITKHDFDNYARRGPYNVLRNGGGKGRPALIEWASVHESTRLAIIAKHGDPDEKTKHIVFTDFIERDITAVRYYNDYTLPNGKAIVEDVQQRYADEASILNAIGKVINSRIARTRTLGPGGMTEAWRKIAEVVGQLPRHTYMHRLPSNAQSLKRRYEAYVSSGYEVLIHKGHGHKNSEKLGDEGKEFVMARWCDRVRRCATLAQLLDEYNEKAMKEGWKTLKEEKTLYNYLYDESAVKNLWYGYRYGELKTKEKFMYQHSTKLPTMRDSLWYSDGTKMNLHYLDENGKMATCQVYEVMDAYSEVFIGYHISRTEDYNAQYHAFKMACKMSWARPYEVRFDNQGGHQKLITGDFMARLSKLAIRTQPYNGKSKTIESAFGRFQMQIMKKWWFFTGQNITAKAEESRANMEFIMANVDKLPTLAEAKSAYKTMRDEWNNGLHHATKLPRIQMYMSSDNPKTTKLSAFEMVDIFWITRPEPIRPNAYGISFTEKKVKHTYMVYDQDRLPDVEWLSNNIDRPLVMKYDPEDMSLIYLYEQTPAGLRFVSAAETKVVVHRGKQEQEDWESAYLKQVDKRIKEVRVEKRDRIQKLLEDQGMAAEQYGLKSPKMKGISNPLQGGKKNPPLTPTRRGVNTDIGEYMKAVSNAEEEEDIYSMILKH